MLRGHSSLDYSVCGLNSFGSEQGPAVVTCKPSHSTQGSEFDYQLINRICILNYRLTVGSLDA